METIFSVAMLLSQKTPEPAGAALLPIYRVLAFRRRRALGNLIAP
jgi:hypothetical protein